MIQNDACLLVPALSVVLCILNSVFSIRITSLCGSQPSFVVLCLQNSVISTRITSLHSSQHSSVVFACKTATFGAELQASQTSPVDLWMPNSVFRSRMKIGYWSQPSFVVLCIQNNVISIRITGLHGFQSSFVVFACKTATLGPEVQVSMCSRPHLGFFCIQNNTFSIRITSLYGS